MIGSASNVKVLVLGNDPQINTIDFDRLKPEVITLGVNRIWLKHIPDYLFFNDIQILTEIERHPEIMAQLQSNTKCFSSDWIRHKLKRTIPQWIEIHRRTNAISFPDSVSTAINIFSSNFLTDKRVTYYLAGVSLKWTNPSHFWKEMEYESLNKHGQDWYTTRFVKMSENFRKIKARGIRVISVNPNSNLNKMFRYESIDNLYK
jgi:hypothetical protein